MHRTFIALVVAVTLAVDAYGADPNDSYVPPVAEPRIEAGIIKIGPVDIGVLPSRTEWNGERDLTLLGEVQQRSRIDPRAINVAIERGHQLLARALENYPKHRDCFSCHHHTLPLMAMREMRDARLPYDKERFAAGAERTRLIFSRQTDKLRMGRGIGGAAATVSFGLWTLDIADVEPEVTTAAMVAYLLKTQRDDGRWAPPSNRPPLEESHVTTTALAAYYMPRLCVDEQRDDVQNSVKRARNWLKIAPAERHEDYVFSLWAMLQLEDASDPAVEKKIMELCDELLAAQRDDGGWSQIRKLESDAYATGQALCVLRQAGLAPTSVFIERGVEFLLRSQHDDGSWLVETRSRPVQQFFDNGDPHGKNQFISIAATSWAVAALARAHRVSELPSPLDDDPRQRRPTPPVPPSGGDRGT